MALYVACFPCTVSFTDAHLRFAQLLQLCPGPAPLCMHIQSWVHHQFHARTSTSRTFIALCPAQTPVDVRQQFEGDPSRGP